MNENTSTTPDASEPRFALKVDAALHSVLRDVVPLSDVDRAIASALFELLDARSDVVHQVLKLLETSEKSSEAKDCSKGVNALIGTGMSRVLHRPGDVARDRRGSEVAHIDERGVLADSDKALQVGDSNHDRRDNFVVGHAGPLQGADQLLRIDEVRPGREILKTGVTHNSSPSVDDAGAHSVGDGLVAGDASATPATEVTDPHISARYDAPLNAIAMSVGGTDDLYFDRDATFLLVDELRAALHEQAKNGGLA